jgi:hypothetical protein
MADFAKALNEAAHRSLTDGESIMVRFDGLDR